MRNIIINLATVATLIIAVSCNSNNRTNISEFTPEQSTLISSAGSETPMRVLQTTAKKDSLLLRTKSEEIHNFNNNALLDTLAARMLSTVQDSASLGVGIAAPQVGILKRVILVQRFDKKGEPFETYVNPKIIKKTTLKQDCREGCLSIPDISGTTTNRSYAVMIEYSTLSGEKHTEMVEGFTAVIFQHEIDHLEGTLFIDHLETNEDSKQ
jgi:peptide deformylase